MRPCSRLLPPETEPPAPSPGSWAHCEALLNLQKGRCHARATARVPDEGFKRNLSRGVLANTEQPAPWGQKSQSVVRADSYGVCTPAMAGFQPPTLTAAGPELWNTITPVL